MFNRCPRAVAGVVRLRFVLSALLLLASAPALANNDIDKGAYLAQIMDCGGCHTPGALSGKPNPARHLAGGDIGFAIPDLGTFFPPNLTSDEETGLGAWSAKDIVTAVRTGARPDGRLLAPVMPWHAYAALTDADAAALAVYIKSLPAVAHKVPGPFGPAEIATAPYLSVVAPATN